MTPAKKKKQDDFIDSLLSSNGKKMTEEEKEAFKKQLKRKAAGNVLDQDYFEALDRRSKTVYVPPEFQTSKPKKKPEKKSTKPVPKKAAKSKKAAGLAEEKVKPKSSAKKVPLHNKPVINLDDDKYPTVIIPKKSSTKEKSGLEENHSIPSDKKPVIPMQGNNSLNKKPPGSTKEKAELNKKNIIPAKDKTLPREKALPAKKSKKTKDPDQYLIQNAIFNQFFEELSLIQNLSSQTFLGLDIDTDKLRYVVVKKSGDLILAKSWGSQLFPTEESDRFKALQIALENVKAKVYRPNMQVHASIYSPDINIRQIVIPKVEKKSDLEKAIYFKNKSDLHNFDEKSVSTHKILNEVEEQEITKLRIMCIVVPGNLVERYMFLFRHLKIDVKDLVPRPAAVQAAYAKMIRYPVRDLVIDISYDFTQICFMRYGRLEYVRNLGIGSHNLEKSIHEGGKGQANKDDDLTLSASPEAEKDQKSNPQDKIRQRLLSKIKDLKTKQNPVLHTFFSEILRSLAHLQKKGSKEFIERIFITGYGIKKESLLPYLRNRLHMPVIVLSPLFEAGASSVEFGDYFTAFGAFTQEEKSYSLLPKHFKTQFIFSRLNLLLSTTIVLSMIGLTYFSFLKGQAIGSQEELAAMYQKQYDAINPAEKKYKDTFSQINVLQAEKLSLLNMVKKPSPVTELLRVFSNETPKEIRMQRIEFSEIKPLGNKAAAQPKPAPAPGGLKYQATIVGSIASDNILADVILVNYINHLRDLGYFKTINLIHTGKQSSDGRTEFQLELIY